MVLDPLEPKRSGALWTSPVAAGLDAGGASTDEAAAEAMPVSTAEGPAESKRLSGRRDEGAYGHLHHDRDDGFGGETEVCLMSYFYELGRFESHAPSIKSRLA